MVNKSFEKLINYFIHPTLRVSNPIYERSKISISALIVIFIITLLYVVFYLSISKGVISDLKSILNYIDIFSLVFALLIIKYNGWVQFALSFLAFIYLILFSISIYVSGGIYSYDISWLIVLSAASYLIISIRTGVFISILSFIIITLFYYLEVRNYTYNKVIQAQSTISYKYFNLTLAVLLLSLLVYFLVRGNKKLQEIVQQNKEQNVREEIAKDFHDQIGNKLASLRHLAEMASIKNNFNEQEQIFLKIDSTAKQVYDNFRDFIWTIDAKSDQAEELFMYMRDFTDDYFKFSNINIFISSYPEQIPSITLPSHYSKEIMPMFKEALVNIFKHANAKNVYFDFIISKNMLSIRLKDDGKGMEKSIVNIGNGLIQMQKRAKSTGGTLAFTTSPNKGVEVIYTVLLPITT